MEHEERHARSTLRRRVIRPWAAIPLVALVGGSTWWLARSSGDDGATPTTIERTVEVTSGPLRQTVAASGTIEAATVDDLSFTSAGTVTAVNVRAGDEVQAGDVLATINSAELEAAVDEAEANVATAEATLDSDQDAEASDARIAADESSLASAQRQLEAAQDSLDGARLVATTDGTVSAVDIAVGEQLGSTGTSGTAMTGSDSGSGQSSGTLGNGDAAAPGGQSGTDSTQAASPHVQVISTGAYLVTLSIDGTQIDRIEAGQEATVSLSSESSAFGIAGGPPGFPGQGGGSSGGGPQDGANEDPDTGTAPSGGTAEPETAGTVASVGAIADASSGVAGYPVEVTFEGSPDEFHVGATADVEIVYEEIPDTLQVPAQAVTTTDGQSTVVVVDADGDRETRTVDTGTTSGGMVQITSGLEAGEQVLMSFGTGRPEGGSDGEQPAGGGGGQFTPPDGFEPPAGGFPGGGGG